ncbi:hypothetical protein EJ05DRAFT_467329 [Pseudovirgaria hyperparasitica]|uniref:Chromatin-remodeling ATPase INO80 n=1 Tax=Pseudovirgaria hyperparasitica TaxID=470096 RepID=A0A6A6W4C1_9PEZI|nr:uncharacterized protein EJ05DRAFT_467329 [Pseudovirgaria hyperparasitica]KAF2755891.1 hypothetical protein EJ05DRAFT_467329 [Pseudovirgaria hyperparasitica]
MSNHAAYNDAPSHSPTQSYSPTSRHHSAYTNALPPITSIGGGSRYYDPTTDTGERPVRPTSRHEPHYQPQAQEPYNYAESRPQYDNRYQSPVATSHPHPSALPHPIHTPSSTRVDAVAHSPISPKVYQAVNNTAGQPSAASHSRQASQEMASSSRKADPMSLSSIMSGTDTEPAAQSLQRKPSKTSIPTAPTEYADVAATSPKVERPVSRSTAVLPRSPEKPVANGVSYSVVQRPPVHVPQPDERDVELELMRIDSKDLSDVEGPGWEAEKEEYKQRGLKRALAIELQESGKRKRRRAAGVKRYIDVFEAHAATSRIKFNNDFGEDAWAEVREQEVAEEKERKKDMQRKRRREKTLANETQKRDEAFARAQQAENDAERTKYLKEVEKAEKKAKATTHLLQGGTPSKEFREMTPHGPNLEGGTMGSFQMSDDPSSVSKRGGRKGTGSRLRKSKEQKQAEKDAAAAAQAAIERGDDLPVIAPREEARLEALKNERSQTEESSTPVGPISGYDSKVYNQLYESIWKDISKKDVAKVYRIKDNSLQTKQSNLRKTAQLASKEARRWQMRTNKSMKDVQARAKRSMREMLTFWKRNERDERDQRKLAERAEIENAKKAEAEREANRQKRKLNFLISQTELYSHFIGKKVKTDEVERSTDDAAVSKQTIEDKKDAHTIDLPDSVADPNAKVTNFEDLDFDAEDETALRQAAMANAQNAVKEAKDRARAFNNEGQQEANFDDEGEMNFQNPTSLGDVDIAQPKLLNCQLKEYQLKGLNWLVNLYEQGINGILADEMGLGKTVQSISVMAYLAEVHNIWGPFLVIAPASTLHNWQQEITRFVPDVKVLPYWGNAKDRKILRKFWDRKHITYTKDSPFHVLVTSYQLVVQDAQYFQKIRWQYMILDEAQAIKSSQSSRWKSLLGFHCRNRLLLTGTPIQNNMQELWALLHFIMPSLFDSHDEFSDWFSKDIESHAQSNTKLNEDQLRRLHMILKPFMLRRIKKHVQKELGDKIELDVFCDLTHRQRAYYTNLRNKISIMDLIEKAVGDEQDSATLMNLVMQFRKVCNHPDLFERAETTSPFSFSFFAETASFMREGHNVNVAYSVRNLIEYRVPRLVGRDGGRIHLPGPDNNKAGWRNRYLHHLMNVWTPDHIVQSSGDNAAFSWLQFVDASASEVAQIARSDVFSRAVSARNKNRQLGRLAVVYDEGEDAGFTPRHALLNIVERADRRPLAEITPEGRMDNLLNVYRSAFDDTGLSTIELNSRPAACAPPVELYCASQGTIVENQRDFFNINVRQNLFGISEKTEELLLEAKKTTALMAPNEMLPAPTSNKSGYTHIEVPSMRRFVSDSGKLAKLDQLLKELKAGDHRVLLYFQMTRMIDLMEEYLTYRGYKYCRLDGSTKLEDRRDTVSDFQSRPEIFVFLLSTRAGGLGINLTSADTVIFYDSDWNPTIDSQAMDRAHRLGQTRQVTVYRLITKGTIEERIRKRALQKEEVQRVVISGGAGAGVDFNTRSRENRTKDMAMWLADDDQAAEIEKREAELAAAEAAAPPGKRKKMAKRKADVSLDEMYHEGEGHFDDGSNKPSGAATPVPAVEAPGKGRRKGGMSKKAKTIKQRLAIIDGSGEAV